MIAAIQEALLLNLTELLVALTLSSLIMILLSQNLSLLSLDSMRFKASTEHEDGTLLALLLLQHQLQSSQVSECAPSASTPYRPVDHGLSIDSLTDTFYVQARGDRVTLPAKWLKQKDPVIVIDDCIQTQETKPSELQFKMDRAKNFPLSLSLKETKTYILAQSQLVLYSGTRKEGILFRHIADFKSIWLPNQTLNIRITPEDSHAPFSLTYPRTL
ncbi:MAG: hypothetical protein NTV32_04465 [Gammaproteobacteria bacterium]|jgi:hypothetical protein|nr:hypothetical protein [Gammaproteobacteria bacterium]